MLAWLLWEFGMSNIDAVMEWINWGYVLIGVEVEAVMVALWILLMV